MLLRTALLCLFSVSFVVSQTSPSDTSQPEVIDGFDPSALLEPMNGEMGDPESSDNVRVIRGLLGVRHNVCPAGTKECANHPGKLVYQLACFFLPSSHSTCILAAVICFPFPSAFDGTMLTPESSHVGAAHPLVLAANQEVSRPVIHSAPLVPDLHALRIGCCGQGEYCYSTGCCKTGYAGCGGNSCCAPGENCCSGGGCCRAGYVSKLSRPRIIF